MRDSLYFSGHCRNVSIDDGDMYGGGSNTFSVKRQSDDFSRQRLDIFKSCRCPCRLRATVAVSLPELTDKRLLLCWQAVHLGKEIDVGRIDLRVGVLLVGRTHCRLRGLDCLLGLHGVNLAGEVESYTQRGSSLLQTVRDSTLEVVSQVQNRSVALSVCLLTAHTVTTNLTAIDQGCEPSVSHNELRVRKITEDIDNLKRPVLDSENSVETVNNLADRNVVEFRCALLDLLNRLVGEGEGQLVVDFVHSLPFKTAMDSSPSSTSQYMSALISSSLSFDTRQYDTAANSSRDSIACPGVSVISPVSSSRDKSIRRRYTRFRRPSWSHAL